jgi:hypothetical protein
LAEVRAKAYNVSGAEADSEAEAEKGVEAKLRLL